MEQYQLLLVKAIEKGNITMINNLIEMGVDLIIDSKEKKTILHYIIASNLDENVKLYLIKISLDAGVDINSKDINNIPPIIVAAVNNNVTIINYLIKNGADLKNITTKLDTGEVIDLLVIASIMGNIKMAKIFINNGVKVNKKLPLINDIIKTDMESDKKIEFIELFLNNGADINFVDKEGYTPLFTALKKRDIEVIKYLITNGADIFYKFFNDITFLHSVIQLEDIDSKDKFEIVKLLIDKGGDLNSKDSIGITPLLLSINLDLFDISKLLLDYGADPNYILITEKVTFLPLFIAIEKFDFEMVNLLIDNGAEVNIKNDNIKFQPLHYTLMLPINGDIDDKKRDKIIKLLLKNGADPLVEADDGYTAYYIAIVKGKDYLFN